MLLTRRFMCTLYHCMSPDPLTHASCGKLQLHHQHQPQSWGVLTVLQPSSEHDHTFKQSELLQRDRRCAGP